jgi:hypothetical protein
MFGDSAVVLDTVGDTTIKVEFRGCKGLWELLTRRNINKQHVTSDDLRTYKNILLITNSHFEVYQPGGVINVTGGKNFSEIISPLFAKSKDRGVGTALRRARKNYWDV